MQNNHVSSFLLLNVFRIHFPRAWWGFVSNSSLFFDLKKNPKNQKWKLFSAFSFCPKI